MRLPVGVGISLVLGLGLGCGVPGVPLGGVCPELTCLDAFEVVFERESEWPAGDYEVEIARDDEVLRCEISFPLDCDASPPCPEASGVLIDTADCDEPPALWRVALEHGQTPEAVRVSVRREGTSLASQTFTPGYSRSQPAGKGCLPICDTAPPAALEVEG